MAWYFRDLKSKICHHVPYGYERLLKGLMGYGWGNAETYGKRCYLPDLLAGVINPVNDKFVSVHSKTNGQCFMRKFVQRGIGPEYPLAILKNSLPNPNRLLLNLPHKVYLWRGGDESETLPVLDDLGKIQYDPSTREEITINNPRFGKKWCFEYGELNWRNQESWFEMSELAKQRENFKLRVPCE